MKQKIKIRKQTGSKVHLILSMALLLITGGVFSSCEGEDDRSYGGSNGYAPQSLNGWTIDMGSRYTFTSENTFTINLSSDESFVGTPSYSYSKTGANTASLNLTYSIKHTSSYATLNYTETVNKRLTLYFLSPTQGYASGYLSIDGLPAGYSYEPTINDVSFMIY